MIQIQQAPLPEPDAKAIHEWLNLPAAYKFRNYIANLQAGAAADVANAIVTFEGDVTTTDPQWEDVRERLEVERGYAAVLKALDTMADRDYTFAPFTLSSMPIAVPETTT